MSSSAGSMTGIPRTMRLAFATLLIPGLLSLSACVVGVRPAYVVAGPPPGELVVNEAPPAPPAEFVTVAPAPGLFWVGGYWGWNGGRYAWVPGAWQRPPRAGAVWVGGYWARRPGSGHVFFRGGWR